METLHYDAFISYRHTPRDTEVAKELQQSLERFRIPRSIRAAYGKDRIDRIFRDQEDLEMTSDLSKKLDDSLRASDFLIVVCSPDYVKSEWCLHELETFTQLKGQDRVLCVLSDGEPPEIFPEILLSRKETETADDGTVFTRTVSTEPLACDYRGSFREAKKIELPRLVSAIVGCGYDELVLRQERYRRRRTAAILSGIFTLSAVAIAYLLWSNSQINRNYRQSQINESRMLSRQALTSLESGDRLSALENALEAVGDGDRPVVDDAVMALTSSSYAYTMPDSYLESWRIDTVNDIVSFSISDDGTRLAALDRLGSYHLIDLASRSELFRLDTGTSTNCSDPVFGKNGDLLVCVSGTVKALDPASVTILWETPLKYGLINSIAVSPDGSLIAAADSYAVQIMTPDGVPALSIPLPEEEEGYITDVIWSPDGNEIAVHIKYSLRNRIGVFDIQSDSFSSVTQFCESRVSADFADDGDLFVISCDTSTVPEEEGRVSTLFPVEYDVYRVRKGVTLWKTTLTTDSEVSLAKAASLPGDDKEILVALGRTLFRLSQDGSVTGSADVSATLSELLAVADDHTDLIMTDGRHCSYYHEADTVYLTEAFPSGCDSIEALPQGPSSGSYVILRNGNISFYSTLSDDSAIYWAGNGFYYPPLSSLRSGNRLMLYADVRLLFYDTETGSTVNDITPEADSPYHLLTVLDGTAYALRVDPETARFILCSFDMTSGSRTGETELPVTEMYTSMGLTYGETPYLIASVIDTLYVAPSPVAVRDGLLCLHDWDDPNRLLVCDLAAGTYREIRADLDVNSYLISTERSIGPAPLLISEDGKSVFSVCYDMASGSVDPVLVSLSDGSVAVLGNDINDLTSAVFADGKLLYSGKDSLHVCSADGELIHDIPFSGDNAVSFSSSGDRLYCVFPDMTLTIYRDGKAERTVNLGLPSADYLNGRAYRYEFTDDRLYLFRDHDLVVISLDSDSSTPLYKVTGSVIDADTDSRTMICYGSSGDLGDTDYHIASFTEYSVEELTRRSREQLDTFLLSS